MTENREKVIRHIIAEISIAKTCKKDFALVDIDMLSDALSMLKEQEAVKPTWNRGKPFCGACGLRIHDGKFCSECGKPIAWEGRRSE